MKGYIKELAPIQQLDLVNEIANLVTRALLKGEYTPDEHLAEAPLARALNVSRAPVREALRLLESRGLVISKPRRGFFVRQMTAKDLDDIYGLRIGIERHVIRELATRFTLEMRQSLYQQIDKMREVALSDSPELQVEEDLNFHRMLCVFCDNKRLLRVFDELTHELRFSLFMLGDLYANPVQLAETHLPIIEALMSADPDRCQEAIEYHIGVARAYIVQLFSHKTTSHQEAPHQKNCHHPTAHQEADRTLTAKATTETLSN